MLPGDALQCPAYSKYNKNPRPGFLLNKQVLGRHTLNGGDCTKFSLPQDIPYTITERKI
jgi:hypothetical protein